MTLTAAPIGPATRYSSFDLYKKGILNSGTSRAPGVKPLQPRVQSTSRVQSNVQHKVNRRSAKRFSPRTILISLLVVITLQPYIAFYKMKFHSKILPHIHLHILLHTSFL